MVCGGKVELAAFQVDAVHTIGAGDTFNAGFLFGLVQGWETPAAVRFGQAAAALVVSSPRGVLGAPRRADVEEFLGQASGSGRRQAA